MKRFTEFLKETKESHVVLAFGRFQPPHQGHEKVIQKVHELADQYQAPYHIVLSSQTGGAKNPLPPHIKLNHVHEMFSDSKFELADKNHPGVVQQAERINGSHTHLHVVAGEDRVQEYQTLLDRYNGKNYNYRDITVHSAGQRKMKSEGVVGLSATKLREYAKNGDFQSFVSGLPSHVSDKQQKQLYNDVRKGLSVTEETYGKALFLTGGPGSGKDIVLRPLLQTGAITEYAPNQFLQLLINDNNKLIKLSHVLNEQKPIIINGLWEDENDINKVINFVHQHNYKTAMVYVYTTNQESRERNESRRGKGRVITESVRYTKWCHSNNMVPYYEALFTEMQSPFYILENETVDHASIQLPQLLEKLHSFFGKPKKETKEDINTSIQKLFLNELFGQGYPIVPDDQDPINKDKNVDWSRFNTKNKTKLKKPNGMNFKTSVDKSNGVAATGPGREFTVRGDGSSFPMGGLGDPSYRESVSLNSNNTLGEEEDNVQPNFGGTGSTNAEPMVTPREKDLQNMVSYPEKKKKKSFKDLRKYG